MLSALFSVHELQAKEVRRGLTALYNARVMTELLEYVEAMAREATVSEDLRDVESGRFENSLLLSPRKHRNS